MQLSKFIQKTCSSLLFLLVLGGTNAIAASPVIELAASDIPEFIAKYPYSVIQFTSPDPNCTYCVGAETPFDAVSTSRFSQPVVFARVKWSAPWKKFPVFTAPLKVLGIPEQKFFKNGKEVDALMGIIKDTAVLNKAVEAFTRHKLNSEGIMVVESSAAVIDVKAEGLVAFLSKHDRVVVQLISSDLNCEFCNGAEMSFNEIATKNSDKTIVYARVQWTKAWNPMPDFGSLIKIIGLPAQVVFKKGQNVGSVEGGYADAQKLQQEILGVLNKTVRPTVEKIPSPSPVSNPAVSLGTSNVTSDEQTAIRTMIRFTTYSEAAMKCINSKSTVNNEVVKSVEDLGKTYAKSIDLASKSPAKFKTSEDIVRYMKWIDEEKSVFKSWQENTLGIPSAKATENDSCVKIIKNANGFMTTKYMLN
jgi:hypothetical protein